MTLAEVLELHWPHATFGCECTPEDDEEGTKDFLDEPWGQHLEAAILAWIGERLDGARDDVAEGLHAAHCCDVGPGECDEPEEFDRSHADAALAVVRDALGVTE